jgi:hypothetical protein
VFAYCVTIFCGAFLLFQVQPIAGKYILPWFGGGPGVWTTCILFFQLMLFAGYAYAHLLSSRARPRNQAAIHFALAIASVLLLPIIPSDSWKPLTPDNPTARIILLLTVTLGLPYFVLSATGPLVQHWFALTRPGRSPYRLYALSNVASLLALLTYPFYFETHFTRITQAHIWGVGLYIYAAAVAVCLTRMWQAPVARKKQELSPSENAPVEKPTAFDVALWLLLPGCASLLLIATTNKLCQDVAVIPFLWILPLSLYLLAFIICFDSPRWYRRIPFAYLLIGAMAAICWALKSAEDMTLVTGVSIYAFGLFVCCMVLHGELYKLRPHPRFLTRYYLMLAAGGALGGIFASLIAPHVFSDYFELHWGLVACAALFLICLSRGNRVNEAQILSPTSAQTHQYGWRILALSLPVIAFAGLDWFLRVFSPKQGIGSQLIIGLRIGILGVFVLVSCIWLARGALRNFQHWKALALSWLWLGVICLAVALWVAARENDAAFLVASRNFFGVLKTYQYQAGDPEESYFLLQHGRITHGLQFTNAAQAMTPVSYYAEESGIGLAFATAPREPRHIGVVGLGTGTVAAYGRSGDRIRYYEINPEVKKIASGLFSYITKTPAHVDVIMGDARLSMEREPPQNFDILALDAFSGDAIPVHLLTKEALDLYARHLKPRGVLVVHISNQYLNLEPIVLKLAAQRGWASAVVDFDEDDERWWLYGSTWVLLSPSPARLNAAEINSAARKVVLNPDVPLWTDDFASLFPILKK